MALRRLTGLVCIATARARGWVGLDGQEQSPILEPPNDLPPHLPVVNTSQPWFARWRAAPGNSRKKWAKMDAYARAWAQIEEGAREGNLKRARRRAAFSRVKSCTARHCVEEEPLARPSRRAFVIVTVQRTGSTWLAEELDRHPCVRCSKELFLNTKAGQTDERSPVEFNWTGAGKFAAVEGFLNGNIQMRDDVARIESVDNRYELNRRRCAGFDPAEQGLLAYPRGRGARPRNFKTSTCGFKWMISQKVDMYWDLWFGRMAAEHGVRLVFLKRVNILRVWVSLVDKRRGNSITTAAKETRTLNIADGKKLNYYLGKVEAEYALLDRLRANATARGVPNMLVTFEELMADRSGGLHAIANFILGGGEWCVRDVAGKNKKQFAAFDGPRYKTAKASKHVVHGRPMSTYIQNWPAVVATLKGTPRERYLTMDGSTVD